MYVLVCDRGFVFVGLARPHPSDSFRIIVDACHCVRRWGTSRGLGQLANEGPTGSSTLDYEGDGVDMLRSVIHRAIPCNVEAWSKVKEFKEAIREIEVV
jgi:hypothetical protein